MTSFSGHISRVSHFDNTRYQNKHTHRADSTNRKTQIQRHHIQAKHAAYLADARPLQLPNQVGVITSVSKAPPENNYVQHFDGLDIQQTEAQVFVIQGSRVKAMQFLRMTMNDEFTIREFRGDKFLVCSCTASALATLILFTRVLSK